MIDLLHWLLVPDPARIREIVASVSWLEVSLAGVSLSLLAAAARRAREQQEEVRDD